MTFKGVFFGKVMLGNWLVAAGTESRPPRKTSGRKLLDLVMNHSVAPPENEQTKIMACPGQNHPVSGLTGVTALILAGPDGLPPLANTTQTLEYLEKPELSALPQLISVLFCPHKDRETWDTEDPASVSDEASHHVTSPPI